MVAQQVEHRQTPDQAKGDIAGKATHGILWSLLGQGCNKGFTLLTLTILARLLSREDFGLVAAASIVISFLAVYKDMGLGNALIQFPGETEKAANSVFTMNLMLGCTLSLSVLLVAPLVGGYFEKPEVVPLLRVFGLSFTITAIGSVHVVLLKKKLNYKKKIIPDIAGSFVKGFVSIALALGGYGVWSIVIGQLVGSIASVTLIWIIFPWRPRLQIDRGVSKHLLKFGWTLMGIDTLSTLTQNLAYVITGKICGIALLGVFTLSFRLPETLLIGNLWVLSGVFFPMFAMVQNQPDKLAEGFKASIRLVSLFATPISFGMFIAAEPLVYVFYGDQWRDAIPILRILALYAWVHSIGFHAGDVYKGIGKPNILLILSAGGFFIDLIALLIGSNFGLKGIASALLAAIAVTNLVNMIISTRLIKVSLLEIMLEFKTSIVGGAVLCSIALAADSLASGLPNLIRLGIITLPAGIGYLVVLWLFEKNNVLFILKKIGFAGISRSRQLN